MTLSDFLGGNAYRIFYDEFGKHLTSACAQVDSGVSLSESDRKGLSGRFHTIKGGAGFFGLTEIVSLARILEEEFKSPGDIPPERLRHLREVMEKLRAAGDTMPKPGGSSA